MNSRNGIICAGNWIVDIVSFIDKWPQQGDLTYISKDVIGLGGCSANQIFALAKMDKNLSILPLGCIGNDDYGRYIQKECELYNISTDYLYKLDNVPTSHTLVIQNAESGQRTFFHHKGANAFFSDEHVPLEKLTDYKIFSLGYLLLLDRLDTFTSSETTLAAEILQKAQGLGFITCLDAVSENSDRFRKIIPQSLPYADYLVINEVEAGRLVGISPRDEAEILFPENLKRIGEKILQLGAKNIIIHCPEGAFWATVSFEHFYPNVLMSSDEIIISVGAGDAFCSGVLYGLHQGYTQEQIIRLAIHVAKCCLKGFTATDNIPNIEHFIED